jgi:multimeric flavodoxin WrbA
MAAAHERKLVLGILGSPRPRSHTGVLLERVLAGAAAAGAETEMIELRRLKYSSCRHCGGCDTTGQCVVQDDMQTVYPKLRAAHHVVLASPIQFSGVSGEMKAMIDRAQCCWVATYRLKQPVADVAGERRGVFVASCGGKDTRVFDWATHTVKAFLNSTGFTYWGELFEANTDGAPPVGERTERLAEAEELGRRMLKG